MKEITDNWLIKYLMSKITIINLFKTKIIFNDNKVFCFFFSNLKSLKNTIICKRAKINKSQKYIIPYKTWLKIYFLSFSPIIIGTFCRNISIHYAPLLPVHLKYGVCRVCVLLWFHLERKIQLICNTFFASVVRKSIKSIK